MAERDRARIQVATSHAGQSSKAIGVQESPRKREVQQGPNKANQFKTSARSLHKFRYALDSLDNVTSPKASSTLTYLPLIFALFPAFMGICFKNGNKTVSDMLLLCLMTAYLHWLVKLPYDWYYDAKDAQQNFDLQEIDDNEAIDSATRNIRKNASIKLAQWESFLLMLCFVGPVLGGYILSVLRSFLTSNSAENFVSNFNITLFVLTACIRGVLILINQVETRTKTLKELAQTPKKSRITELENEVEELHQIIKTLESSVEKASSVAQAQRPDIDALTRAIKRYERNEIIKTQEFESRIEPLEIQIEKLSNKLPQSFSPNDISDSPATGPTESSLIPPHTRSKFRHLKIYKLLNRPYLFMMIICKQVFAIFHILRLIRRLGRKAS
ncbi:hypothetical protein V1514DRAFT_274637 [Lipomyces japonicus]|uniref:uncharacterized protein n=1 Tax=Lipomyces japonicus TaxID=56871 RepID=UPI0034CF0F72